MARLIYSAIASADGYVEDASCAVYLRYRPTSA